MGFVFDNLIPPIGTSKDYTDDFKIQSQSLVVNKQIINLKLQIANTNIYFELCILILASKLTFLVLIEANHALCIKQIIINYILRGCPFI